MAKAKKKAKTPEQQRKTLNKERADIVAHLGKVQKRSEKEAATAAEQTSNLNERLVEVDAKIAALPAVEVEVAS